MSERTSTLVRARHATRHGAIQILLAAALWGTTGTAASFAPAGTSPLAIGAGTMGFGGLLLWLVGGRPRHSGGRPILLATGASSVAIYPLAFYTSMDLAGVAVGTVVTIGSGPVFAALYERVIDRRPLRPRWVIATLVAIVGCAVLTAQDGGGVAGDSVSLGIGLAVLSGASYAGYSYAASRAMADGLPHQSVMGAMFGLASLILLPVLAFTGRGLLTQVSGPLVLGYLALIPMGIAYVMFGRGLATTPASVATTITLFEPVVAALLSVAVLGQRQTAAGWFGIACVGTGLVVLTVPARRSRNMETATPRTPE